MHLLLLPLLLAPAALAEVPTISLEEAERQAEAKATGVAVARLNAEAADARLEATRAARLPVLTLSGNVSVWTDALEIQFLPAEAGVDCSTWPAEMVALCAAFSTPITVRDQVTGSGSVRVVEPLTGQLAIHHQIAAAEAARAGAASGETTSLLDARYQAADAWFLAAQVERQKEIADAQVQALDGRVQAARTANQLGALTRGDLLLVELAYAQARQTVIQVGALETAAWVRLGVATGNGGEPVRPAGESTEAPRTPPDVDALIARALAHRPELETLRQAARAADEGATLAGLGRLPSVSAVGLYTHTEGQGLFAEPDSAFVGLNLDWQVFAWGQRADQQRAARAGAAAVRAQIAGLEAGIRAEVRARADALAAAGAALEVARASIEAAEESLRIQERRREAGTATMTELLDAEAALVRALSNQAAATCDARRAEAALARAVGQDPWAD